MEGSTSPFWSICRSGVIVSVDQIRFHPLLHDDARQQITDLFCCDTVDTTSRRGVASTFSSLNLAPEQLLACGQFEPGTYHRIEIAATDDWVLLALFWADCSTEIHDHDESECGFQVLKGRLVETRFAVTAGSKVREVARRQLEEGKPVSSNKRAIHCLQTVPGEQAMSLHAYCPVLDCESMNVFEIDEG